jgi:hypothetical protein
VRQLIGAVQDVADALASVGIPAWVMGGALLGLMRDGKLIEWDKDIDFGVMHKDWKPAGRRALQAAGFAFNRSFTDDLGHYQSRWTRGDVVVDIFHHRPRGDTLYCAVWGPEGPFAVAWPTFTLEPLRVGGVNVLAPRDPIGYLEHQYGDWRTPRPDWVYYRDQLNMEAL